MLKFIIVNYVVIESNFFTLFEQMISKKTSKYAELAAGN